MNRPWRSMTIAIWLVVASFVGYSHGQPVSPKADSYYQLRDVSRAHVLGASPSATASANTTAIQTAINTVAANGGGVVSITRPGTYLLATQGVNPYAGAKRYCLNLGNAVSTPLVFHLGSGVTLKLADAQQTDAGGGVDILIMKDRRNVAVIGEGPGKSRITGNTAGQSGWTQGYSQTGQHGAIIKTYGTNGVGNKDLLFQGLQLDDHWSCPIDLDAGSGATLSNERCVFKDLYAFNCGEGLQIQRCDGVVIRDVDYRDTAAVAVGDAIELSACDHFLIDGFYVESTTSGGAGSAIDLFGSKFGVVTNGRIKNWGSSFAMQNGSDARTVANVTVSNIHCETIRTGTVLDEPQGVNCKYSNITIDCTGGPSVGAFQMNGAASLPLIEFDNITCLGANSSLCRGGRKVKISNFVSINPTDAGLYIARTTAENPDVHIDGLKVTGSANYGLRVTGGGSAFLPTGLISNYDLSGNTSGAILIETGADVTNLIFKCGRPTKQSAVTGSTQQITGLDVLTLTGSVGYLTGGYDGQILTLEMTNPDIYVQDMAAGGTRNISLPGAAHELFGQYSSVTLRYHATLSRWFEHHRTAYPIAAVSTTSRLFAAASSQSLSLATNPIFEPGARDWSMIIWFWENATATDETIVSYGGQNGWNITCTAASVQCQYVDAATNLENFEIAPRPAAQSWNMLYMEHRNGVHVATAMNGDALVTRAELAGLQTGGSHTFRIGARGNASPDLHFTGRICCCTIYAGLMDDATRAAMFNGGNPPRTFALLPAALADDSILAFWPLNEASGLPGLDKSFGGNTLTSNNTVGSAAGPP